jgi:hypothetical protein
MNRKQSFLHFPQALLVVRLDQRGAGPVEGIQVTAAQQHSEGLWADRCGIWSWNRSWNWNWNRSCHLGQETLGPEGNPGQKASQHASQQTL